MQLTQSEKNQLKKVQSRFFRGNILAQSGHYLTSEDVDELRKEVLKSYKLKRFNKKV